MKMATTVIPISLLSDEHRHRTRLKISLKWSKEKLRWLDVE